MYHTSKALWQHTLTCELRLVVLLHRGRHTAGNIRLRASCDTKGMIAKLLPEPWQHTLTCELRLHCLRRWPPGWAGNIRLRASCAPLSDRFRYQVTLRFICVWTSVQNGFSNSVSVSRRRTRTGHCSLRHFLPPCFAFEVRGFGRLGHALPL